MRHTPGIVNQGVRVLSHGVHPAELTGRMFFLIFVDSPSSGAAFNEGMRAMRSKGERAQIIPAHSHNRRPLQCQIPHTVSL